MAFWGSQKLRLKHKDGADGQIIVPFDPKNVKCGAYELALGPEVYVTSSTSGTKQILEAGKSVVIPPGQFALLLTEETVAIPADVIAFISIRAGIKFRGLVNVSGFHVDPGFRGRLKFAVYNAGAQSVVMARGDRLFPIWFGDMAHDPVDDGYMGEHLEQNEITSQDVMRMQGEVASPAALRKEIDGLDRRIAAAENNIATWRGISFSLGVLVFGPIVKFIIDVVIK